MIMPGLASLLLTTVVLLLWKKEHCSKWPYILLPFYYL